MKFLAGFQGKMVSNDICLFFRKDGQNLSNKFDFTFWGVTFLEGRLMHYSE